MKNSHISGNFVALFYIYDVSRDQLYSFKGLLLTVPHNLGALRHEFFETLHQRRWFSILHISNDTGQINDNNEDNSKVKL